MYWVPVIALLVVEAIFFGLFAVVLLFVILTRDFGSHHNYPNEWFRYQQRERAAAIAFLPAVVPCILYMGMAEAAQGQYPETAVLFGIAVNGLCLIGLVLSQRWRTHRFLCAMFAFGFAAFGVSILFPGAAMARIYV